MACAGVATRDWSFAAESAGRMPGTTIRNFGPHAARMAFTSWAEATTPSNPATCARRASAKACTPGESETPISARASASMLVRIVTPSNAGRLLPATASRAARIIALPPHACSVSSRTPGSFEAEATAPATVLGISWNFKSRNIPKRKLASFSTTRGPSAVKSWLPTFTNPAAPWSLRAKAHAGAELSTSSATINCDVPKRDVKAPRAVRSAPWLALSRRIQGAGRLRMIHRVHVLPHRGRGR